MSSSIDVLGHGIVPNDATKRSANSTRLKALLDRSKAGPQSRVLFTPVTGADTYYFDAAVIVVRDGIWLDLCGGTLDFAGSAVRGDINSGMFFALREFGIENGAINVAVNTSAASSSGYAIQIGARGTDSPYVTVFDSLLAEPLGHVFIRNLRITINNTGANLTSSGAIGIVGGIRGLVCENVYVNGSGTLRQAIVYEFGWATNPAGGQTSHARDMHFRNINVQKMDVLKTDSTALVLAGADDTTVEGLTVVDCSCVISVTPGESLLFKPWRGKDATGPKPNIRLRNIVGAGFTSIGISLMGAQLASGGYLAHTIAALGHPDDYRAQTGLLDVTLEEFSLHGTASSWGVLNSAGRASLRNGRIIGCQRGVVSGDEGVDVMLDGVDAIGCTQMGMTFDQGGAIWNPPRKKRISVRNCFVAGNSTSSAGKYFAIHLGQNLESADIEGCRFGHEGTYDGVTETTQAGGVFVSSKGAQNVKCRRNWCAAPVGVGNTAYYSNVSRAQGNSIENASGDMTTHGNWARPRG